MAVYMSVVIELVENNDAIHTVHGVIAFSRLSYSELVHEVLLCTV